MPFPAARHLRSSVMTLAVIAAAGLVGGVGYAMAINDIARVALTVAASAAIVIGWAEGRRSSAARRDISDLPSRPTRHGTANSPHLI